MLFGDHRGWATQVPVHLLVAEFLKATGQEKKVFGVGMEELWGHREGQVGLWEDILELPVMKCSMALGIDEGGQGCIESREMSLENAAKMAVGDSSDGCQDEIAVLSHGAAPLPR